MELILLPLGVLCYATGTIQRPGAAWADWTTAGPAFAFAFDVSYAFQFVIQKDPKENTEASKPKQPLYVPPKSFGISILPE